MSVDKFKFVSPGVFANEIDESILPKTPEEMGPVIVGRALRGPVMRPVKVGSFAEFVEVFGEPVAGGVGGDVWRESNKLAPTYGAYAAQAYLKNSGPVTFIRLAGFDNEEKTLSPGWSMGTSGSAYGLFVAPTTSSVTDVYTVNATASLAAIIYAKSGATPLLYGKKLSGSSDVLSIAGEWIRADAANLEFKVAVGGATSSVNFDEDSKKYIRSVLNTNPTLTNTNIVDQSGTTYKPYFLGETFKSFLLDQNAGTISSANFAAALVKLSHADTDFSKHDVEAKIAETGMVVAQHKGTGSAFIADPTTKKYPVQELFQFKGLTEGEWNSKNLKISIEDIKESTNKFYPFGTFTVSVRKIDDTDVNPSYLERFTGLSLDRASENYIAKKIGDKYTEWDFPAKEWKELGTYNNQSKYIRVAMNAEVDAGQIAEDLLPYGYYGPKIYPVYSPAAGTTAPIGSFIGTVVSGNQAFTASFALPELSTINSNVDSLAPSLSSLYWGVKTNVLSTKRFNKDVRDLVSAASKGANPTSYSYFFSLDDVKATVSSTGAIVESFGSSWQEGYRASGQALSTNTQFTTGSDGSSLLLSKFNKFTMPLVGGFDGVDITEKDPFNKRVLEIGAANYAYNSVKIAIESLADPEVVEMNLAAMPGIENEALTSLLIEKCEARGDALAIIDLKGDYVPEEGKATAGTDEKTRKPSVDAVVKNLKNRALNSSYGTAFFPWVLAKDTINNNTLWLPSSAIALGTFSSSQKKTELWFAPAGFNRGGLSDGAAGLPVLQTALRLSSKDRDKLYEANINPIATFPSEGIVVFGQKTLQVTPSALDRINVRRLMIYVKKEISRMASTVLFDPNIEVTWKRFTNKANPFLDSVKSRFGLTDFKVVLDSTTTTPDLVDRNIVYAKIFLKPARAIEFIALDFVIANTGASFSD